jgi:hypothetical protein
VAGVTDWAPVLAASATIMTVLGTGIGYVWQRIEKRISKLERALQRCTVRHRASEYRESGQSLVITALIDALDHVSPGNRAVASARSMMMTIDREAAAMRAEDEGDDT